MRIHQPNKKHVQLPFQHLSHLSTFFNMSHSHHTQHDRKVYAATFIIVFIVTVAHRDDERDPIAGEALQALDIESASPAVARKTKESHSDRRKFRN